MEPEMSMDRVAVSGARKPRVAIRLVAFAAPLLFVAWLSGCLNEHPTFPLPQERVACGSYEDLGSFHGNATGAVTDTVAGCAFFVVDTLSGTFFMWLTDGPLTNQPLVRIQRTSALSAYSTYNFGSGAGELGGAMFLGARRFQMQSGTLQTLIVEKPSTKLGYHMEGQVTMTAMDSTGAMLTVIGKFIASCIGVQQATPGKDPYSKPYKGCEQTFAG
jgi:hypothetical protein